MRHRIEWKMAGTVWFDSDETEPRKIADDFITATEEGLDFTRHGDCDSFDVDYVDDKHVHNWILSFYKDKEFCPLCSQRRDVST